MKTKAGVVMEGVKPEILFVCGVAHAVHDDLFHSPVVVTSLIDGKHMPNSLHYTGRAVDFRDRDLSFEQASAFVSELSRLLVPLGFQVIREKDHIHVEFDCGQSGFTWRKDVA